MMLQLESVDDFVLATGKLHSVQQFVEKAFEVAGLNWRDYVKFDEALVLRGRASRLLRKSCSPNGCWGGKTKSGLRRWSNGSSSPRWTNSADSMPRTALITGITGQDSSCR